MRRLAHIGLLLATVVVPAWAAAQPETGRVRISTTPSGATVYLDDPLAAPIGVTPLRERVPVGEHTFIIRLEGYEEVQLVREVSRRRTLRERLELERAAYLDLQAGDETAFGAELTVNGEPAGRIPVTLALSPGRHLVLVSREGYQPYEAWYDLTRGETEVATVVLGAATQGSILVTADIENAQVWLNGTQQGVVPLVLEGVSVGEHQVELRVEGWRPYTVPVTVTAGEQVVVSARITSTVGELQIIGNVEGAEVVLNGESVGEIPFLKRDMRVGDHILEIRARGYQSLHETVSIVGGMRRVLAIHLEPRLATEAGGTQEAIFVTSDVPDARVFVDGTELGPVPASLRDTPAGAYEIEVSAPDHQPYRTRCTVARGQGCRLEVVLFQGERRLRLTSATEGATLAINGRPAGSLPYNGGLPDGDVELTVSAAGYDPWTEQVATSAEGELVLEADLRPEGERPPGQLLRSAFTIPVDVMALDLSVGWWNLAEVRFDMGVIPHVDAGGALRTFGRLTEIEARGRYEYPLLDYLVVGGVARLGGGFGPRSVNTFFLLLEANTTVHLDRRLSATLIQGLDFYTDHYPFAETDSDVTAAETGRQNTLSYRLGLAFDLALWRGWSLWTSLEWTALRTKPRRVLGDLFGFGGEAQRVSLRAGLGFVF